MEVKGNLLVKTTQEYSPIIVFDWETLQQARKFVEIVKTECQWFHRVRRALVGNHIVYHIYDLYIPEQEVTDKTVDSGPEVMMKLSREVRDRVSHVEGKDERKQAFNDVIQTLTCWSHSHVNMPIRPSGTDDENFSDLIGFNEKNSAPIVMLIFNKKGEAFTRVYDKDLEVIFENVQIMTKIPVDFQYVEEAAEKKITEKKKELPKVTTTAGFHSNHHGAGGHWSSPGSRGGWTPGEARTPHTTHAGSRSTSPGSQGLREAAAAPDPKKTQQATAKSSQEKGSSQATTTTKAGSAQSTSTVTQTNSRPMPTGGLSSGEYDQEEWEKQWEEYERESGKTAKTFPPGGTAAQDLLELVAIINSTNKEDVIRDAITSVCNTLRQYYSAREIDILNQLLWGDIDSAIDCTMSWVYLDETDGSFDEAWPELRENLKEGTIEPAMHLLEAIRVTNSIAKVFNDRAMEFILAMWFADDSLPTSTEAANAASSEKADYKPYKKNKDKT